MDFLEVMGVALISALCLLGLGLFFLVATAHNLPKSQYHCAKWDSERDLCLVYTSVERSSPNSGRE